MERGKEEKVIELLIKGHEVVLLSYSYCVSDDRITFGPLAKFHHPFLLTISTILCRFAFTWNVLYKVKIQSSPLQKQFDKRAQRHNLIAVCTMKSDAPFSHPRIECLKINPRL